MPQKGKNGRRRNQSSSGSGRGQVVTSLSASMAWDKKLAVRKDSCTVNDRVPNLLASTAATSYTFFGPLGPTMWNGTSTVAGAFGARVFSISQCFLRFRINKLLACWRPIVGTTTPGIAGVGFVDDPDPLIAEQPGTVALIQELRCSHTDSVYRDIEVEWSPLDPKAWYYVDPDPATQSVADLRMQNQCALAVSAQYLNTGTGNLAQVTLYYSITFEGADSFGINA
jgi:hypothetical protein